MLRSSRKRSNADTTDTIHQIGSFVLATVDNTKLPWPSRIERLEPSSGKYWVYCRSDNAVLPSRKIIPLTEVTVWTNRAEKILKRKPQTLQMWKDDVKWAQRAVSRNSVDEMQDDDGSGKNGDAEETQESFEDEGNGGVEELMQEDVVEDSNGQNDYVEEMQEDMTDDGYGYIRDVEEMQEDVLDDGSGHNGDVKEKRKHHLDDGIELNGDVEETQNNVDDGNEHNGDVEETQNNNVDDGNGHNGDVDKTQENNDDGSGHNRDVEKTQENNDDGSGHNRDVDKTQENNDDGNGHNGDVEKTQENNDDGIGHNGDVEKTQENNDDGSGHNGDVEKTQNIVDDGNGHNGDVEETQENNDDGSGHNGDVEKTQENNDDGSGHNGDVEKTQNSVDDGSGHNGDVDKTQENNDDGNGHNGDVEEMKGYIVDDNNGQNADVEETWENIIDDDSVNERDEEETQEEDIDSENNSDATDDDYVPDSESDSDTDMEELKFKDKAKIFSQQKKGGASACPMDISFSDDDENNSDPFDEDIEELEFQASDKTNIFKADVRASTSRMDVSVDSEDESQGTVCSHDPLDDALIERDVNNPEIYVRKRLFSKVSPTGRKKSTARVWNNYHCCFVCKKLSTNIVKHLLTHKDNVETMELISLRLSKKKEDKSRCRSLQTLLRNKGDHEHNLVVKKEGGELIIARKAGNFNMKDYGPCPNCFEWIKLECYSGRHQSTCPAVKLGEKKMTKGEAIVKSSVVSKEITEVACQKLVGEVYPIMTRDDITQCAKIDPLIVGLGNNWLKRNLGNKIKRKYYTSSRMRGAARLLQHLRALTGKDLSMNEYLTPAYFDQVCEAALLCAQMENDDVEDIKSPSTALKVGFDIGRMCNIKLGIALRSGNQKDKKVSEEFLTLMKMEWTTKVSRMAHLKLREYNLQKPDTSLPVPQDLSVLGGRVMTELINMDLKTDFKTYKRAAMLLETRLLTYNKRRSGELEALSLDNYRGRSKGLDEADNALLGSDLTDLERYLVESQELIKIRGKNGKIVPVLVPEDARKPLEFITSADVRRTVGVKPWNNYVFANTGDGVIRAYDSLKSICGELDLKAPDRITSVTMRKYIATLSQVIDLKDYELEWLCNHLGHTASIHKLHYRSTSGFIERVNIGKLMLMQDLNIAGKFAGQRLQDIDFSEMVYSREEEEQATVALDPVPADDGVIDEDFTCDDGGPKKRRLVRQAWSVKEEDEIRHFFVKNFKTKKNPGLRDCTEAMTRSRKKNGEIHKRTWETLKKKVMRMIKKET